jgi:hypothetical protein
MARQRPSTRPPGHSWAAANYHRDDDPLARSQAKVAPDASDRVLLAHGRPALHAIPRAGRYWAGPAKSTEPPYGYPNRRESASPRRPPVEDLPIYRLHALAQPLKVCSRRIRTTVFALYEGIAFDRVRQRSCCAGPGLLS